MLEGTDNCPRRCGCGGYWLKGESSARCAVDAPPPAGENRVTRFRVTKPCLFEGCGRMAHTVANPYCPVFSGLGHQLAVQRMTAAVAKRTWAHELLTGWRQIAVRKLRPVALYGLIDQGGFGLLVPGGKFGKTATTTEQRWMSYERPFLPVFTTDYSVDNHGREMDMRHLIRDAGDRIRGHEYANLKGMMDVLAMLENDEDVSVKLWVPPADWVPGRLA